MKKTYFGTVLCLVAIVAALYAMGLFSSQDSFDRLEFTSTTQTPEQPYINKAVSKWLVMGDVFWGRSMHSWSQKSSLGYDYPFSGLKKFDKDNYDAWIANLECPVTDKGVNQHQQATLLKFNCPPEYMDSASRWFDVLSLANNHTDNQAGTTGLKATRRYLEKYSIQYFGHYDMGQTEDICEVVSVPATTYLSSGERERAELPMAWCGFQGVYGLIPQKAIDEIKSYAAHMPVFAMPHSGAEYQARSDMIKRNQYRAMVDAGADAVFGSHPHWVQESEIYKDKLIVYSLGNFIFDQQFSAEVRRGAVISVELSYYQQGDYEGISEMISVAKDCKVFQDNCLTRLKSVNKLGFELKYDALASDSSNKLTKPASSLVSEQVLQRLDWGATMSQYNNL